MGAVGEGVLDAGGGFNQIEGHHSGSAGCFFFSGMCCGAMASDGCSMSRDMILFLRGFYYSRH